jgi:hypothetical protein
MEARRCPLLVSFEIVNPVAKEIIVEDHQNKGRDVLVFCHSTGIACRVVKAYEKYARRLNLK